MNERVPWATARAYHEATKHSPRSVRSGGRLLDWRRKPEPFKAYEGLPRVQVPTELRQSGFTTVEALAHINAEARGHALDLEQIGRLLLLAAGVTRTRRFGYGDVFHFRTYASAGALYPNEIYLVCGELEGLESGVYHFDPLNKELVRIRSGDHRGAVVRATAEEPAVASAPATLVVSAIPWRTAWKYGERGYRHVFWDAGMIVANILALAASARLPARVVLGFTDEEVEALIGLDGKQEFSCCLVPIGAGRLVRAASDPARPPPDLSRVSRYREAFPETRRANGAGRLASAGEVRDWRTGLGLGSAMAQDGGAIEGEEGRKEDRFFPATPAAPSPDPLEAVIKRRGSARAFGRGQIPADVLASILALAVAGVPTDYAPTGASLVEPYLIASAVEGLVPGAYLYTRGGFRLLEAGNFRREAGFLCLEQRLGGDAAATVFLMTDLQSVFRNFGERGYRVAQLEGGIAAGKLYLAAYAHRFGATGLTFYDDEVTAFFSPHAASKSCLLVVAVGESTRPLLPLA